MTITPMPPVPPAGTTPAPAGAGSDEGGSEEFGSLLAQLAPLTDPAAGETATDGSTSGAEEPTATADGVLALLAGVVQGAPSTPGQGGLAEAAVRGAAAPGGQVPGGAASVGGALAGADLPTAGNGAVKVLAQRPPDAAAGVAGVAGQATPLVAATTDPAADAASSAVPTGVEASLADMIVTGAVAGGGADGDPGQQTQPGAGNALSALAAGTPTSAAGAATATAAPAGVAASPLLDQVAPVVSRMVSAGEGSHRMVLRLHPADLGEVQLTVTVRGEAVDVTVAAGTEARELLAGGSSELRSLLDSIGRTAGQITFRELPGAGQLPQPAPGVVTTGDQPDAGQPGTSYGELAGDSDGDDGGRGGSARTGPDGSRGHGTEPEPAGTTRPSSTPGSGALDVRI